MATVALLRVGLSASDTVTPLSITTGVLATWSPSVKVAVPPEVVTTDGISTETTLTSRVPAALVLVPSLTVKETVRTLVSGLNEVLT